jgi:hypothetical protein
MYCNYRISCTTIIVYHEPQLEHIMHYNYSIP